jgi:hypothetical protein
MLAAAHAGRPATALSRLAFNRILCEDQPVSDSERVPVRWSYARRPRGHQASRASTRRTCTACHSPRPLAVGMPRLVNSAAMACSEVMPFARSALMVGATSAACRLARPTITARPIARAPSVSLVLRTPPSFVPLALAAASAALVRLEIISASSSARSPLDAGGGAASAALFRYMPTVRRF